MRPSHDDLFIDVEIFNLNRNKLKHAGHTRKASRISKAAVDNCGKGVGNLYLSYQTILVRYMHLCIISDVSRL